MKKWLKVVALAILVVFSFSVVLVGQMGEKGTRCNK